MYLARLKQNKKMKNLQKIFFISLITLFSVSCSKSPTPEPEALRDYTEQYTADKTTIETFLKTHKMTVDANFDVKFDKTTVPTESIWGAGTTHNANIKERIYTENSVNYTIYYIEFQQGTGTRPCNLDGVLAAYKGRLMDDVEVATGDLGTVFDSNNAPQSYLNLDQVIRGWSEIFPQFKTGTYTANADGTISYNNFGAGVMFVPSALAYYNNSTGSIPSYSTLIFSFKLYEIKRNDQDFDGVPSWREDLNNDNYIYYLDSGVTNIDDTDGDYIPNAYDIDDDNDRVQTKFEIKNPLNGQPYNFDAIPLCPSDNKKIHVSTACQN